MRFIQLVLLALVLAAAIAALLACGQTGALYLPPPPPHQATVIHSSSACDLYLFGRKDVGSNKFRIAHVAGPRCIVCA